MDDVEESRTLAMEMVFGCKRLNAQSELVISNRYLPQLTCMLA